MVQKEIISQGQRRKLPEGFGWVDHRLVRENLIEKFSAEALALYLFLVTVGDEDAVSWYSDETVCRKLNFSTETLKAARRELTAGKLVAHRKPHYQVLELPRPQVAEKFHGALSAALAGEAEFEDERRQPAGTEGKGVLSLSLPGYRCTEGHCDILELRTVIDAMAGGAR